MSGHLKKVCLAGPAKVGGRWLSAGMVEVTDEEEAALKAAGLLAPETDASGADVQDTDLPSRTYTAAEWETAVAAEAKAIAADVVPASVEAALEEATAEKDAALARVAELEAQLKSQAQAGTAGIGNESAEDGETAPAPKDTPPSEKAAKTAPKKGAAAIQG